MPNRNPGSKVVASLLFACYDCGEEKQVHTEIDMGSLGENYQTHLLHLKPPVGWSGLTCFRCPACSVKTTQDRLQRGAVAVQCDFCHAEFEATFELAQMQKERRTNLGCSPQCIEDGRARSQFMRAAGSLG